MAQYVVDENSKRKLSQALKDINSIKTQLGKTSNGLALRLPFVWVEITGNSNNVYQGDLTVSNGDGTFTKSDPLVNVADIYSVNNTASDLTGMVVKAYVTGDAVYSISEYVPNNTSSDPSVLTSKVVSGYLVYEWIATSTC